jgi:hypothetical protein
MTPLSANAKPSVIINTGAPFASRGTEFMTTGKVKSERRRALSIRRDIGMAARWPSGSDFGAHAR